MFAITITYQGHSPVPVILKRSEYDWTCTTLAELHYARPTFPSGENRGPGGGVNSALPQFWHWLLLYKYHMHPSPVALYASLAAHLIDSGFRALAALVFSSCWRSSLFLIPSPLTHVSGVWPERTSSRGGPS